MTTLRKLGLAVALVNSLFLISPQVVQAAPTSISSQLHIQDCSKGYYKNSYGTCVHSPTKSKTKSWPVGSSALCGDGTYSYSLHRSGTCSHHGGVSVWH